jgi:tetratricopeptide (TPR) repeat protein
LASVGVEPGAAGQSDVSPQGETVPRALGVALVVLVALRLAYHLSYLLHDPFALVTFSDGQLYEDAARDILAHFPLGTRPLYLQGLYAYLLAFGMALSPAVVSGLLLQLALAGLALLAFHHAARLAFGAKAAALSSLVLLAGGSLAFYENKYLSVSLGVGCNVALLWAFARTLARPSALGCVLVGAGAGLSLLGRPNLLLGVPFALVGLLAASPRTRLPGRAAVLGFCAGLVLAVAPLATRNLLVVGEAAVFPSHGGGIPFYIGNNPHANGRWNTAGGLLSGQVFAEQQELAARLGLPPGDPAQLDARIGQALRARAFDYIASDPLGWLGLEARKLAFMLGNHEFVRDYDRVGEAELLGVRIDALSLPFGCTLGLGLVGLGVLLRRARREPAATAERAEARAWLWLLGGQLGAIAAANLLVFTSAQNRVPLVVPLSFVAGPALLALWQAWHARSSSSSNNNNNSAQGGFATSELGGGRALLVVAALATAQAFVPRAASQQEPSSVHHFNLAVVLEELGRDAEAARAYGRAARKNPEQAVFALRHARALRQSGQSAAAARELDRAETLGGLPPALARELQQERQALGAGSRAGGTGP